MPLKVSHCSVTLGIGAWMLKPLGGCFLRHLFKKKNWWVWWQILANLFESQPWNQWMMQASHDATNDASVMYEKYLVDFSGYIPKNIVENKWHPAGTSWRCFKICLQPSWKSLPPYSLSYGIWIRTDCPLTLQNAMSLSWTWISLAILSITSSFLQIPPTRPSKRKDPIQLYLPIKHPINRLISAYSDLKK